MQGSDGFLYGLATAKGTLTQYYGPGGVPLFTPMGTLFKLSTTGANFSRLYTFEGYVYNGQGPGMAPFSTPTLHTSGVIYGLTLGGGYNSGGSTT